MWITLGLILLALIFAGVGLFVTAAKWALIVAAVLLVTGVVFGSVGRHRSRT